MQIMQLIRVACCVHKIYCIILLCIYIYVPIKYSIDAIQIVYQVHITTRFKIVPESLYVSLVLFMLVILFLVLFMLVI